MGTNRLQRTAWNSIRSEAHHALTMFHASAVRTQQRRWGAWRPHRLSSSADAIQECFWRATHIAQRRPQRPGWCCFDHRFRKPDASVIFKRGWRVSESAAKAFPCRVGGLLERSREAAPSVGQVNQFGFVLWFSFSAGEVAAELSLPAVNADTIQDGLFHGSGEPSCCQNHNSYE